MRATGWLVLAVLLACAATSFVIVDETDPKRRTALVKLCDDLEDLQFDVGLLSRLIEEPDRSADADRSEWRVRRDPPMRSAGLGRVVHQTWRQGRRQLESNNAAQAVNSV